MEIFRSKSHFAPPETDGSHNVLSFEKGEKFEILEKGSSQWCVARKLETDEVGYVPTRFMKFLERQVGKLLEDKSDRERNMKKLAEMQNSADHKHPDQIYSNMVIPEPDYDDHQNTSRVPIPQTDNNDNLYNKVPVMIPYDQYSKLRETMYPDLPEPDYDEGERDLAIKTMPIPRSSPKLTRNHTRSTTDPGTPIGDDGLIKPKKLHNPCLESKEMQALHRELLVNKKAGIDVLKKSELEKTFEKRRETQRKVGREAQKMTSNRTSFEAHLAKQAEKIVEAEREEEIKKNKIQEEEPSNEFMRIHRKIRSGSITESDSS